MNLQRIAELVRELLVEIGEDPNREGLDKTPQRVARAIKDLTAGYRKSVAREINGAIFESHTNNMIIARDIEVFSLCEHHMLPFFGRCHIGYIAKRKVLGVSKLDRCGREMGVNEELLIMLEHMILSHHDLPEYGSPKPPMFPEAEALHTLDLLDARMFEMRTELARVNPGSFTERIWSLERKLYRRKERKEGENE